MKAAKKQSQFKAKQIQSPACGRESEARSPKSEGILQNKANLI
jgi:hypothetical protein